MLSVGEILNARYRVERALGKGGMGAVYLATHLELEQQVAIKEMLLGSLDPEARAASEQQFRAEARILNRLRHGNLPRVYDFFELDDRHYLVMDFIKGGTLEVLHEKGPLPEGQVMTWTRELCDVLSYLHSNTPPVIFRDLKPSNIMLTEEGSIRLIDFGIAKVFEPESGEGKTVLQGAASHGFAAPEQYGMGGTDARSDIYSLGATLYALLTGLTPPPSMEVAAGITTLESLKALRADLSDPTVSAVEWMMQVHRDMRPPTMSVVQEALGFRTAETGAASLPHQMRAVIREEFHQFFPIPEWQDRGNVLTGILAGLASQNKRLQIFSVVGEPGLGKSRLLRELAARVPEGFSVFPIMHGAATLQDIPFGCVLPSIGAWIRQHGEILAVLKERLYPEAIFEVAQVLPEIKSLAKELPVPPVRDAVERHQSISTAICLVLEEAARRGPALLLLDDMQWVDENTIRLLDTIRIGDLASQVGMVLAVEAVGPEHACRAFINRWARRGELIPIHLPNLSRDDMAPYVHAIFPPIEGLDRQLDLLLIRSGGNPLLLEEILRFLVVRRYVVEKNGILALTEFPEDILPGTLEDAVRRRREHLPLETQQLLGKTSVAGVRFDLRTALKLTGESTITLTEALTRACETMFVAPEERGVYTFTSVAARDVFYQGLPAPQRSEIHRKLAIMEEERSARTGTITFAAYHHKMAEQAVITTRSGGGNADPAKPQVVIEVLVGDAFEMKEFQDTRVLTAKQLENALDALSLLLRGARNMGMSVLKGSISQSSVGTAVDMITRLVDEAGALIYTQSGEAYHVNRQEVAADKMPYDFKSVLSKHRISGFEFQSGVDRDEMRVFLDLLMASRETVSGFGGWKRALVKHRVRNVVVSELIYVGVSEAELFDPTRLRLADEVVVKLVSSGKQVAKQKNDHFDLNRIDDMLASGVATGQGEVVQAQLAELRQMLETIRAININRLQSGPVSGELTGALEGIKTEELQQLIALSKSVEVPLKQFMGSRIEVLVQALESQDPQRRTVGAIGLLRQGREARRRLLYYLRTSDNPVGRAAAVFVLMHSEDQPAVVITEEILRTTTGSASVRRLLDAMRLGEMGWNPSLSGLLLSPLPDVRQAMLEFLRVTDMNAGDKLSLVLDGMNSSDLGVVDDTVHFVGELGEEQAVAPLATLMDKIFARKTAEGVKVQEHICHALGHLGSPQALPLLKAILIRKGFLVGTWETSVRAAALYALSHIPGTEARELLKKQASDTDATVSRTAQFLLSQADNGHKGAALLAALESGSLSMP